eukprot:174541_1
MQIGSIFVEAGSMFVLNSTNTAIKIGIKDKIEKVVGIDTNDDIQYKVLGVIDPSQIFESATYWKISSDFYKKISLSDLIMIYFGIWTESEDMSDVFVLSSANVQQKFNQQIMELAPGDRIELDFGTWRSLDFIDGTPLKNVTFGSGTNWMMSFIDPVCDG